MIYRIYYYIYKNSDRLTKDFSDANDAAEFMRQVKYDYKSKDGEKLLESKRCVDISPKDQSCHLITLNQPLHQVGQFYSINDPKPFL